MSTFGRFGSAASTRRNAKHQLTASWMLLIGIWSRPQVNISAIRRSEIAEMPTFGRLLDGLAGIHRQRSRYVSFAARADMRTCGHAGMRACGHAGMRHEGIPVRCYHRLTVMRFMRFFPNRCVGWRFACGQGDTRTGVSAASIDVFPAFCPVVVSCNRARVPSRWVPHGPLAGARRTQRGWCMQAVPVLQTRRPLPK